MKTGFSNGPHTKEECNNPGGVLKWTVMVTLTVIGDSSTDVIMTMVPDVPVGKSSRRRDSAELQEPSRIFL